MLHFIGFYEILYPAQRPFSQSNEMVLKKAKGMAPHLLPVCGDEGTHISKTKTPALNDEGDSNMHTIPYPNTHQK